MTGFRGAVAINRTHHCETCGKWAYRSRKVAKRALRILHPGAKYMREYRCPVDDNYWHFGHRPGCHRRAA